MPFELTDKFTTGDAGMLAWGTTLEELFADAAGGLMHIMVDVSGIKDNHVLDITVAEDKPDRLYYRWLSELIYHKDVELFLVKRCEIHIDQNSGYNLRARLFGDIIDTRRHTLKIDVKAVTFYRFRIEFDNGQWRSEVVFDL